MIFTGCDRQRREHLTLDGDASRGISGVNERSLDAVTVDPSRKRQREAAAQGSPERHAIDDEVLVENERHEAQEAAVGVVI